MNKHFLPSDIVCNINSFKHLIPLGQYKMTNEFGTTYWFKTSGIIHREGGPAVEYSNGNKYWYKDGVYHREDGPACEFIDGVNQWYLNGKKIDCDSQEEFLRLIKLKAFW